MAEARKEKQQESGHENWNSVFADLLKRSLTRPSSEAIAEAVRRRLSESDHHRKTVSTSLVEKWRSKSSKSSKKPSDPKITRALVNALDDLGVFNSDPNAAENRAKLFKLLGFADEQPKSTETTQDQVLNDAWKKVRDELRTLANSANLEDEDLLLAVSCLFSQQAFNSVKQGVSTEANNVNHIVIFFEWDASPTPEAQDRRNKLTAELQTNDFTEYLSKQQLAGINVDLVFGIHGLISDPYYDENECISTIKRLTDKLTETLPRQNGNTSGIRVSWNKKGYRGYSLWLHLYPNGVYKGWKVIRHPDLFEKIKNNRVAAFCSPLREDEWKDALQKLEIRWENVGTCWKVKPGEHIYPEPSNLAEPTEG